MIYTIFKDQAGEYRWRLRAKNRITIAVSGEGYKNKKDCSDSIDLAQASSSAPVIDTTLSTAKLTPAAEIRARRLP